MEEKKMLQLAERLSVLRDEKSDIESELKTVNGEIEAVNRELSDKMADSETPSFTHGGFTYSLTTKRFASPLNDDGADCESGEQIGGKERLYEALKQHGFGHLFTVNPQTLTGFVKDMAFEYAEENNGAEGLPDWLVSKVKLFDKVSVSVRKAAKK